MRAADVMTGHVLTVCPETSVAMAAKLMSDNPIGALPVTDEADRMLGIVSEGDLVRGMGAMQRQSRWFGFLTARAPGASGFVRSHATKVSDVMTRDVVSISADAPLGDLTALMERRRVKRLPVIRDGKVVGIVSRTGLIKALANEAHPLAALPASDRDLKECVIENLKSQPFGKPWLIGVSVLDGIVTLWGPVSCEGEREALRIAAQTTPGVQDVRDETMFLSSSAIL